jgi:hypothetical protein
MAGKIKNKAAQDLARLRNQKRKIASSGGVAYWSRLSPDERAREVPPRIFSWLLPWAARGEKGPSTEA